MKFAAGFAIVGLIISTSFGFVGGNRLLPLIMTSVVCTILSGGVGVGVYKTLELRVPEMLEIFRLEDGYLAEEGDALDLSDEGYSDDQLEEAALGGVSAAGEDSPVPSETKAFGDHIIVENIPIKNEPRLMAAAIKTLLARDEGKA